MMMMNENKIYDKPLYVDPPNGHKYIGPDGKAFPKIYQQNKDGNLNEWLIKNGYPQKEIYKNNFHCRFWEVPEYDYYWKNLIEKYNNFFPKNFEININQKFHTIIENMLETIQNHTNALKQNWREEVDPVIFQEISEINKQIRIYYKGGNQYIHGIVKTTENLSNKI